MIPKQYRLKKRSAFNATYKTGKACHSRGITVFCGKKQDKNYPMKVGFVVSKKIHKRAVKRNRIKRLMRESYRLLLKKQTIENQYLSLVFVASSKLLEKDFAYINKAMSELVNKL